MLLKNSKITLLTVTINQLVKTGVASSFQEDNYNEYDVYDNYDVDYSYAYDYETESGHLDIDLETPKKSQGVTPGDSPSNSGFRGLTGTGGARSPFGPIESTLSDRQNDGPLRRLQNRMSLLHHLNPDHPEYHHPINALRFYGCWCLPTLNSGTAVPSKGAPIDKIDSACRRAHLCYTCAEKDHPDMVCHSRNNGYGFNLHSDIMDPMDADKRSIECLDDPNSGNQKDSCSRSLCECDKQFAEDLRKSFHLWNRDNMQKMAKGPPQYNVGGFDAPNECRAKGSKDEKPLGPNECCGQQGGVRMPFHTHEGRMKCCGDKTYDSLLYTCCDGALTMDNTC